MADNSSRIQAIKNEEMLGKAYHWLLIISVLLVPGVVLGGGAKAWLGYTAGITALSLGLLFSIIVLATTIRSVPRSYRVVRMIASTYMGSRFKGLMILWPPFKGKWLSWLSKFNLMEAYLLPLDIASAALKSFEMDVLSEDETDFHNVEGAESEASKRNFEQVTVHNAVIDWGVTPGKEVDALYGLTVASANTVEVITSTLADEEYDSQGNTDIERYVVSQVIQAFMSEGRHMSYGYLTGHRDEIERKVIDRVNPKLSQYGLFVRGFRWGDVDVEQALREQQQELAKARMQKEINTLVAEANKVSDVKRAEAVADQITRIAQGLAGEGKAMTPEHLENASALVRLEINRLTVEGAKNATLISDALSAATRSAATTGAVIGGNKE